MEMPQHLSPFPPPQARLHPLFRRKGTWPRVFPFRLKASNLAFPAARRTERLARTEGRVADRRVAVELEQETAAEKMTWTQVLVEGIRRQTTGIPVSADQPKLAHLLLARWFSSPIRTRRPMTPLREPGRRISRHFPPLPSPSRSSPPERSTRCSSTCPTSTAPREAGF